MIKLSLTEIYQKAIGINKSQITSKLNKKPKKTYTPIIIRTTKYRIIRATSASQHKSQSSKNNNEVYENFSIVLYSMRPYLETNFRNPILKTFPKSIFTPAVLDETTVKLAKEHDAVCLFVNDNCDEHIIEKLAENNVKLIAMRCAGYDRINLKAAKEHGIKIVRVPTYSPSSVAEHAVSLLMTINRKTHFSYNRVWQGNYTLSGLEGFEVKGKTVGVIGTGAIGTAFCRIMKGFGCRVVAYDVKETDECKSIGVEYISLNELLKISDIISLHCPLLKSTFKIINKENLKLVKKGVTLINVSRGGLVDTEALISAIEDGTILNAAMDVYENEGGLFFKDFTVYKPQMRLKAWDKQFAELKVFPNVLITPHSAFLTFEALKNISDTTVLNIKQFVSGEALTNEVK